MNRTLQPPIPSTQKPRQFVAILLFALFALAAFSGVTRAQGNQLSLADILIALRSKKVTLPARNKILSDAIVTRGTTFSLTPEIEKELAVGGADMNLIDSIRQKTQILLTAAVQGRPKAASVTDFPTADFTFYEKRAAASDAKGDLDAALMDYTKAIELNPAATNALMGRAELYLGRNLFTLALADYTAVIAVNPQDPGVYARRAQVYEKRGNLDLAAADYKKALEIDPANEPANAYTERTEAALAKEREKLKSVETAPAATVQTPAAPKPSVIPSIIDLGLLTESQAIRMVKPVYPAAAARSNIGGKVIVEVELSTDGTVVSAKAVNGHAYLRPTSEEAARRSKFKPGMVGNVPVKAKATITYNFVPTR